MAYIIPYQDPLPQYLKRRGGGRGQKKNAPAIEAGCGHEGNTGGHWRRRIDTGEGIVNLTLNCE